MNRISFHTGAYKAFLKAFKSHGYSTFNYINRAVLILSLLRQLTIRFISGIKVILAGLAEVVPICHARSSRFWHSSDRH